MLFEYLAPYVRAIVAQMARQLATYKPYIDKGMGAAELSKVQAARLAAILPSPKSRSASKPAEFVRRRAAQILDGAETIRRDGRAACFED